jgi:predicted Zn-dependent protease
VLSNSAVDALRIWAQEVQPGNLAQMPAAAQVGSLYGATLSALKQRDFALAQATLARLQDRTLSDPAAARLTRLLAQEAALVQGDIATAARLQKAAGAPADTSRAALFLGAQTDTLSGKAESAAQNLQTWVADHPRDAQAWQLLAAANVAINRPVAAVRAEAEVNVAQLDYTAALTRFKVAQDMARKSTRSSDHIEASIVDTRARQMESTLREQALER